MPAINKCVCSSADVAVELNEFVNLSETPKPNIREWMLFVWFSRGLLRPRKCHPEQPRLLSLTPSFHTQSFYDVSAAQLLFTLDFLLTGPSVCCNKKPILAFIRLFFVFFIWMGDATRGRHHPFRSADPVTCALLHHIERIVCFDPINTYAAKIVMRQMHLAVSSFKKQCAGVHWRAFAIHWPESHRSQS